jgi:hypothetical protein
MSEFDPTEIKSAEALGKLERKPWKSPVVIQASRASGFQASVNSKGITTGDSKFSPGANTYGS